MLRTNAQKSSLKGAMSLFLIDVKISKMLTNWKNIFYWYLRVVLSWDWSGIVFRHKKDCSGCTMWDGFHRILVKNLFFRSLPTYIRQRSWWENVNFGNMEWLTKFTTKKESLVGELNKIKYLSRWSCLKCPKSIWDSFSFNLYKIVQFNICFFKQIF